jgi:serine O-acetyltransferase
MILGEMERAMTRSLPRDQRLHVGLADWSREYKRPLEWSPARALLGTIRSYQRHAARKLPWSSTFRRLAVIRFRWWSAVTGAEIPLNSHLAGGLVLPHPNGVVIHPDAEVGPNCIVFQQVTIGMRHGGVPRIGGHVEIGAGAKILGAVTIGSHAKIGANALVLTNVPAGATAVGSPAKVLTHRKRDEFQSSLFDSGFAIAFPL